ncbi:MAG TPA: hypothetical protein DFS52_10045 [Myxococcales bacterium]|jgi:hypothetical protein|nr:hypothetical protein [Myxococcales bacterium]
MKLRGTIRREDLSGGFMVLETEDGRRFPLGGATKALREEGIRVELEGEFDAEAVSIAMTGEPVFRVKRSVRL